MANLERIYFKSAVNAEEDTRFVLIFEKQVEPSDTTVLRCELHDPVFNIEHCLGDIKVKSLEVPTVEEMGEKQLRDALKYVRVMKIKFPEKLAGGTFQITVLVSKGTDSIAVWETGYDVAHKDEQERIIQQKKNWQQRWDEELIAKSKFLLTHPVCCKLVDPSSIVTYYLPEDILTRPVEQGYFSENITVNSSVTGAPKLQDIYIANNDSIEFGKDSITQPSLKKTSVLQAHEIPILHVHSRGMYGKEVFCLSKIRGGSNRETKTFRILDNTLVCSLPDFTYNANDATTYTFDIFVAKDELALNNAATTLRTSIQLKKNTVKPVTHSTSAVYTSTGKDPDPPEHSDAQCKVEFRPAASYDGSFGFSWYRFGDMEKNGSMGVTNKRTNRTFDANFPCNDQPFAEIMGRHYELLTVTSVSNRGNSTVHIIRDCMGNQIMTVVKDSNKSSLAENFRPDIQMVKNHRYDYQRIEMSHIYPHDPNDAADPKSPDKEYYIPYMTLRKGIEAELQLLVTVKGSTPSKLIFDFDNPKALEDGFLQINGISLPYEIASPAVTGRTDDISQSIKIKCLKEFSKPLRLRVRAEIEHPTDSTKKSYQLCGAVNILPNDLSHQRNIKVLFVNVITMLEKEIEDITEIKNENLKIESEKHALQKYLGQAYINPQIEVVDLDLLNDDGVIDSEYPNMCKTVLDSDNLSVQALNFETIKDIRPFLLSKIKGKYGEHKYEHYFKIFFLSDPICEKNRLPNQAGGEKYIINKVEGVSLGEKFILCVPNNKDSIVSHEILHSLGLPHTFDGTTSKSKYVYENGMTDNLMDYRADPNNENLKLQSLFHWQWQAINIKI